MILQNNYDMKWQSKSLTPKYAGKSYHRHGSVINFKSCIIFLYPMML